MRTPVPFYDIRLCNEPETDDLNQCAPLINQTSNVFSDFGDRYSIRGLQFTSVPVAKLQQA